MRSMILLAGIAVSASAVCAQSVPIKLGLWQKEMVTTGATPAPMTIKAKSCVDLATWQEMAGSISKQHEGCSINTVKNAHGYTMSGSCKTPQGAVMEMNGTTTIQDPEHIVSQTHTTTTAAGKKREIDSHSTSHFLGSDCGKIKPGEPEMEDE